MRFLILLAVLFTCQITFAKTATRLLMCDAEDSFDRKSKIELNVNTKVIRMQKEDGWKTLYSSEVACGLPVNNPDNCKYELNHNFDNPKRPHEAATFSARCKIGDTHMIEQNANMEVNRFGDGTGSFICGRLSIHNLYLTNCKAKLN